MLYIIGLGLNEEGISLEGKSILKKCKKIYLDNYTIEFPYSIKDLQKSIGKKPIILDREDVETNKLIKEAKRENICLLVYGSPLFATTHISLVNDCKKFKVKFKIIYSASVFDTLAETGLQLYKFGKISSMPKWQENFKPNSFLNFVKDNKKIGAHSVLLVDLGLNFKDALEQLARASETKNLKLDKIVVCSRLGTKKGKIYYGDLRSLKKKKLASPFCFIIPSKMHFLEKEVLSSFK